MALFNLLLEKVRSASAITFSPRFVSSVGYLLIFVVLDKGESLFSCSLWIHNLFSPTSTVMHMVCFSTTSLHAGCYHDVSVDKKGHHFRVQVDFLKGCEGFIRDLAVKMSVVQLVQVNNSIYLVSQSSVSIDSSW